ncbi:hypothetical protein KUTeg_012746, partial [Tegillarca granosa]
LKVLGEKKRKKFNNSEEECVYWINNGLDKSGFSVKYISDYKGFGVFSTEEHCQGDFLLEYVEEHISLKEAEERSKKQCENMIIDASSTMGHICKYVNDGSKS